MGFALSVVVSESNSFLIIADFWGVVNEGKIASRRQTKSFLIQQFFKNAGEVWASSPHLRSKLDLQQVFLMQLHFLKLTNSQLIIFMKQVANSDASLSACVLFAGEYVVRIADESFLDCSLQEVLLFLKWRTAFSHVPLKILIPSHQNLC